MPSPEQMEQRWEALYATMERNITTTGVHFMGVFGDQESPSFCYSVGLADRGWPELIAVGLPLEAAHVVLNDLVSWYAKAERRPAVGDCNTDVANLPLRLGSVGPVALHEYCAQAVYRQERVGGPPPTALQMVIPDSDGNFPLDSGYNLQQMGFQPAMAANGEWDYTA
jgi:hypothetical protein